MNVCTHTQALPSQTGAFLIPCFRKLLKPAFYQSNSAVIHSQLRWTQGVHSSQLHQRKGRTAAARASSRKAVKELMLQPQVLQTAFFAFTELLPGSQPLESWITPSPTEPPLQSHEQLELSLQKRVCSPLVINISIFPDELVQTQILASKAGSFQTDQTQ